MRFNRIAKYLGMKFDNTKNWFPGNLIRDFIVLVFFEGCLSCSLHNFYFMGWDFCFPFFAGLGALTQPTFSIDKTA